MSTQDFKDILSEFFDEKVEFILVGAHALAAQGFVRATGDLDLWVRPSEENAQRVAVAFQRFGGAPLSTFDVEVSDLASPGIGLAIGAEPHRIDIHTAIAGLEFDEASATALTSTIFGVEVRVLSHRSLVKAKEASFKKRDPASPKRAQDAADLAWLKSRGPLKQK